MPRISDLSEAKQAQFAEIIRAAAAGEITSEQARKDIKLRLRLNVTLRTIQRHMEKYKVSDTATPGTIRTEQTGSETQTLETLSPTIRTLEDALKKAGVDRKAWDVERFIINHWEMGAKGPDGRVVTTPLWQVKVWLRAKRGWDVGEFRKLLVEDLRKLAPSYRVPKFQPPTAPLLAELSIFDAHFGKLAWAPESTQNYDLKICKDRYLSAGRDLLARAGKLGPERILYVVGNDFFHTDQGRQGTTTNGTPQDCDGRWQKAFRIGKDCAITLAEEGAQVAPVDVLVVPGNHDAEKTFCLGEVLAARFHQHPRVRVFNSADVYSYYRWGKVLLGFVHGDQHGSEKKREQLPTTMATDRPLDWAETVWREFHLGHFHSEQETLWRYRTVQHVRDIAVRILPSLSSTDAWHRRSGYKSVLAAECHVYHKDLGRYQYLVHCTEG